MFTRLCFTQYFIGILSGNGTNFMQTLNVIQLYLAVAGLVMDDN